MNPHLDPLDKIFENLDALVRAKQEETVRKLQKEIKRAIQKAVKDFKSRWPKSHTEPDTKEKQ